MSTQRGLLDAIRADREADLPRLVYADWCDDNGRPERAELIRVQVELSRVEERIEALRSGPIALLPNQSYAEYCEQLAVKMGGIEGERSALKDRMRVLLPWMSRWTRSCPLGPVVYGEAPSAPLNGGWMVGAYVTRGLIEHVVCTKSLWFANSKKMLCEDPIRRLIDTDSWLLMDVDAVGNCQNVESANLEIARYYSLRNTH